MSKENNFTMPLMCPQCNSRDIQFQLVNHQELKSINNDWLFYFTLKGGANGNIRRIKSRYQR